MALAIIIVAIIAFGVFISRAGELFYISVRDGKLLVVRGRVPVSLLQELREICNQPKVRRGSIRGYRTEGGGQLSASGVDEGREQRMRNTFMLYPASKLRLAPMVKERTLGQVAGIAWLAWMMDRSNR